MGTICAYVMSEWEHYTINFKVMGTFVITTEVCAYECSIHSLYKSVIFLSKWGKKLCIPTFYMKLIKGFFWISCEDTTLRVSLEFFDEKLPLPAQEVLIKKESTSSDEVFPLEIPKKSPKPLCKVVINSYKVMRIQFNYNSLQYSNFQKENNAYYFIT